MIAVSTLNDRARVSCRRSFAAMGWQPGHPIIYSMHGHLIAIRSAPGRTSRFKIGALGQIWLPAQTVRATRLRPGDSIIVLALPIRSVLVIIPTSLVQEALSTMVEGVVGAT